MAKLNAMSGADSVSLAGRIGFVQVVDSPGQLLIIPAGMLVAELTVLRTHGLRWCLNSSDEAVRSREKEKVRHIVSHLLAAHPGFSKGPHQKWLDFVSR